MNRLLSLFALGALLALFPVVDAWARGGGQGGGRGQRRKPPTVEEIFERFDEDENGVLTEDEVPERAWKRIGQADENGDGEVTQAELEAHRDANKGRRGGRRGGRGGGSGGASD